jgi:hypothetical protein
VTNIVPSVLSVTSSTGTVCGNSATLSALPKGASEAPPAESSGLPDRTTCRPASLGFPSWCQHLALPRQSRIQVLNKRYGV